MALPNGDLITTPFDPQMAYPSDRRMQVDTLNSRDSISMFIRWEGMPVYVLENSKIYILQGGRSNEYWKELGTGSGTGGTTFVGQFSTADLLPTSGRSAGDYAFVGTGDDFVQYNWDNISGQWVMAEGQTDMASEFFHIGYKTPLRRPVIFPLFPKDVLVQESGDFVFAPETAVARFIFVGEVDAIRGIETAAADREIKLVNRTGSDIPLRDKASGIPSDSGFDFGGTDYTWVNGSEITLKGNGTYWQLAPNNQIAFSDHLDSVNANVSITTDNLELISNLVDQYTKSPISFKEVTEVPSIIDGIINIQKGSKYYKRVLKEYNLGEFNVLPENSASGNAENFTFAQTVIPHDSKVILPVGVYNINDIEISKSGIYDFSGVTLVNNQEVAGQAINIAPSAEYVQIIGLKQQYTGQFYTNNPDGTNGVSKRAIQAQNNKSILTNCRASGFSHTAFYATNSNESFYLLNCIASNNGYAGCFSNGKDFQVLGGEYSYNGGSNTARDGYGVVCNMYNGDSKVIGVTSVHNCTRNLDSHVGRDLIFANNYTSDAGQPHPQWFNVKSADGLSIRVTQRIDRCIIYGNISKRATLAGISISGGMSNDYLRNISITGNILEDNDHQIHIRHLETNKLKISDNQEINTKNTTYPVQYGLMINPFPDTEDRSYLEDLDISGNSFDSLSTINLSGYATPSRTSKIRLNNNTFKILTIYCYNNETDVKCTANNFKSFTIVGGSIKSTLNFTGGNTIDAEGENLSFSITSGFNGYVSNKGNLFKNSISTTQIVIPSKSVFSNNTIVVNHEISPGVAGSVIRSLGNDYSITDNDVIFNGVTPFLRVLRLNIASNIVVKGNKLNGQIRIDHSSGSSTVGKLLWDTVNGVYDFGTNTIPSFGDFVFPNGSVIKNNTSDLNRPSEWIIFNGNFVGRGFTKKGTRELTATNPVVSSGTTYADYFNVFSGTTTGGSITVNVDAAPVGETVEGVVTGASKTFVEGPGFTIIRPTGSSLTLNQYESFSLKFISDTQAVLTINRSSSIPNASTTQRGIIEQATDAEVKTGTDTERSVDPKGLKDNYISFTERNINSTGTVAIAPLTYNIKEEKVTFTGSGAVTLNGFNASVTDRTLILINKTGSDITIAAAAGVPVPFAAAFTIPNNQSARFQVSSNLIIKEL